MTWFLVSILFGLLENGIFGESKIDGLLICLVLVRKQIDGLLICLVPFFGTLINSQPSELYWIT